jgi:hypothetical protein
VDRAGRTRDRPHLPGPDRPSGSVRRPGPLAVHPALEWAGHGDRRDRRNRGHHRATQAHHAGVQELECGEPRGLGDDPDGRHEHRRDDREPASGQPERAGHDYANRPEHGPERRSGSRLPGLRGADVHDHQVRRRRELAGHARHGHGCPGAGYERCVLRLGRAAASEQGSLGLAVARVDRDPRQPHARHRRQRQRVLSVVEHTRRRRLERVAGRLVLQRLRRSHLLGRRNLDVSLTARAASRPGRGHERLPVPAPERGETARGGDGLGGRPLPVGVSARRHRADPAAGVDQQRGPVRAAHHGRYRAGPMAVLPDHC